MVAPRTIIVTGKGGVGKTSVAAATGLRASERGERALVISTDPAHSLADALGTELGDEPVAVADGLWAQEVKARAEMERSWGAIRAWMGRILALQGIDDLRAEELTVPPGMDELFALLQVREHHRSGDYDAIIVDCAPTGETLRLLAFPEVARWWLERILPWNRRLAGAARPLLRSLDLPMPAPEALGDVERLAERLIEIDAILRDTERCSIRLVLSPDRMVMREAQRMYSYLGLYGYRTDAVIANRLLPADRAGEHLAAWAGEHERNLASIRAGFDPVPVLTAPWLEREPIGVEMLARLGGEIYEEADPVANLDGGRARTIMVDGEAAVIRIPTPFADRDEVELKQSGDELIVSVAGQRRTMMLPTALAGKRPAGAKMNGGELEIRFQMSGVEKVPGSSGGDGRE